MLDGHEREIRIVLVVDGVELDVLDEFEQVRELEGRSALRFQERRDPGNEIVELRHVREHVIRDNEIGTAALARELAGERLPEEFHQRRHADALSRTRHRIRGIDAEHRHAHLQKFLRR